MGLSRFFSGGLSLILLGISLLYVGSRVTATESPDATPSPFDSPPVNHLVEQQRERIEDDVDLFGSRTSTQAVGILNGDFEAGDNGDWITVSTSSFQLIVESPSDLLSLPPFDGRYMAFLGAGEEEISLISQSFTLPEGDQFQIEFQFWIESDETTCFPEEVSEGDFASIWIDEEIVDSIAMCDLLNTDGWVAVRYDLLGQSGDVVVFDILAGNNADSELSAFFVDAVKLVGETQSVTPTPTATALLPTATPSPSPTPFPTPSIEPSPTEMIPSPTPLPGITPMPPVGTPIPVNSELLNGDFEAGPTVGWVGRTTLEGANIILQVEPDFAVPPRSGNHMAALGGGSSGVSVQTELSQSFIVPQPSEPGIIELIYYYQIVSEDTCGFDRATVFINDVLFMLYDLCGNSASKNGWVQERINLTDFAGQPITLSFGALVDDAVTSFLVVDDVSVKTRSGCLHQDIEPNNVSTDSGANIEFPDCGGDAYFVSGEFVDGNDLWDIYRFVPSENMRVDIGLEDIPNGSDFDLFISGSDGFITDVSTLSGPSDEIISTNLEKGQTYYFGVFGFLRGATGVRQTYLLSVDSAPLSTNFFGSTVFVPHFENGKEILPTAVPLPTATPTATPLPDVCTINEIEPNDRRREVTTPMVICPQLILQGGFENDSVEIGDKYFDSFLLEVDRRRQISIELLNVPAGHNYDLFITEWTALGDGRPFTQESNDGGRGAGESLGRVLEPGQYHITVENNDPEVEVGSQQYQIVVRYE